MAQSNIAQDARLKSTTMPALSESYTERLARKLERSRLHLSGVGKSASIDELRSIPIEQPNRRTRIAAALRAAEMDPDVLEWLRLYSWAKSDARLDQAEYYAWRCNQAYPYHPQFEFEYARALAAQKKFLDAEPRFRSAAALGYPGRLIIPLLRECSQHTGDSFVNLPPEAQKAVILPFSHAATTPPKESLLAPDLEGLRQLLDVTTGTRNHHIQLYYRLMRTSTTFHAALIQILNLPEFRSANLDLIYVLGTLSRNIGI